MAARKARFRIVARFDSAGAPVEGWFIVDRNSGVVEIRPLRRRAKYMTDLGTLATLTCQRQILAARNRKNLEKANKAKARKAVRRLERMVRRGR